MPLDFFNLPSEQHPVYFGILPLWLHGRAWTFAVCVVFVALNAVWFTTALALDALIRADNFLPFSHISPSRSIGSCQLRIS